MLWRKLLLALLFLGFVGADRVGLIVQYDENSYETKCVSFVGDKTAEDILLASGMDVVIYHDPVWGAALCAINGIGCPEDDCFCSGWTFWNFLYKKDGSWQMSNVGIGSLEDDGYRIVQGGGVIGFRWGGWGETPKDVEFSQICRVVSATPQPKHRKIVVELGDNLGLRNELKIKEDGGIGVPFAEVIVRRKNGRLWEIVEKVKADYEGKVKLVFPEKGKYHVEVLAPGCIPYKKEVWVVGDVEENVVEKSCGCGVSPEKNPQEEKVLGEEGEESLQEEKEFRGGGGKNLSFGWERTGWETLEFGSWNMFDFIRTR